MNNESGYLEKLLWFVSGTDTELVQQLNYKHNTDGSLVVQRRRRPVVGWVCSNHIWSLGRSNIKVTSPKSSRLRRRFWHCGFWQPTGGLTARVVWPGLRVGGRLAPCHTCDCDMNRVNSQSESLRCGYDSIINIIILIIIIIIC